MSEPLMHYGSHGGAECGAHGDGRCEESTLTKDPALVTCPTCRGWLPIVANWKPKPTPKPDPSVPLSAIRALVRQWREEARADRKSVDSFRMSRCWTLVECANELAALCPAPTEDR